MTTRIETFGGNIGIGTDDPGSFRLNVNGDVKADSLVINDVTNSHIPIGLIAPWYGIVESIPTGWVLCDGTEDIPRSDGNGTINVPDLRDRFVRGATSTPQVGQASGANAITLSEATLAGHTHTFTTQPHVAPHQHGLSNNSTAPHGHGNSGQNNMPHTHPTGDHEVPHSHGESTENNMPHSHSAVAANMPHGHNALAKSVPHSHVIESTNQNTSLGPGNGSKMARINVLINTSQSNAPHSHGSMPTINVPHSHPNSNHPANHNHGIESVGPQHAHGIPTTSGSASHAHSDVTADNMSHPHVSDASNMLHTHTGITSQVGQGGATSVTNPYRLLAYIMKI